MNILDKLKTIKAWLDAIDLDDMTKTEYRIWILVSGEERSFEQESKCDKNSEKII